LKPFTLLTKKAIEALRYRAEDVMRSITKSSIKEARAKELRLEMLNSERLKNHFEERPGDLAILKHDKLLHKTQELTHLKHIPQYLRDAEMPAGRSATGGGKGVLPHRKRVKQKSKQLDPLKAIGGFKTTTKREEEPTAMEKRAEEWAKKNAPKKKKEMEPILKGNVKKRRR